MIVLLVALAATIVLYANVHPDPMGWWPPEPLLLLPLAMSGVYFVAQWLGRRSLRAPDPERRDTGIP